MRLPQGVLDQRLEAMPGGPDHQVVWHLCQEAQHHGCYGDLGKLAVVTLLAPEVPSADTDGWFLMRLHPLSRDVQRLDDDSYGVRMNLATSFRHSTVWHGLGSPE
ncbi:MAG TPA: hypothetical protein VM124_00350 [Candidatus Limnocylindrales bacterium]|nr:hypothetical protein [Candidatus Limnocylindrales bacterium]